MNRTKIEYLDYTLNLFVGCNGVDCAVREHCWAMVMAKRQRCEFCRRFIPHYHSERWVQPFQVKKSSRIGLNFMSDTFDRDVVHHLSFNEMMVMIEKCYWHTFITLTKQPQNISFNLRLPKNLWLGVSVNKRSDLWRIETLLQRCGENLAFVSFEPLYEDMGDIDLKGIDWVIIGAQTRPTLQPDSYWVWSLRNEALRHNIPVFMKNNLDFSDKLQEFPKDGL
jgi:protein gp37